MLKSAALTLSTNTNSFARKLLDTSPLDVSRRVRQAYRKAKERVRANSEGRQAELLDIEERRLTGRMVCGKKPTDFRDFQRVEATEAWAKARGIDFAIMDFRGFKEVDWSGTSAIWIPFIDPREGVDFKEVCRQILYSPDHVKIIFDIKGPTDPWLELIETMLRGRDVSCRSVSPERLPGFFQEQVQYNHFPAELKHEARKDVIIVDTHPWEPLSQHIQVMAALEILGRHYDLLCTKASCELKIYLTSFTALEPYRRALNQLAEAGYGTPTKTGVQNPLEMIERNFLQPAPTREGFKDILARGRLFLTFHTNLTDMAVFEALTAGIPTAILPESLDADQPKSLWAPNKHAVPGYDRWLQNVADNLVPFYNQGSRFDFIANAEAPYKEHRLLKLVFFNTWDHLWSWVNPLVHQT